MLKKTTTTATTTTKKKKKERQCLRRGPPWRSWSPMSHYRHRHSTQTRQSGFCFEPLVVQPSKGAQQADVFAF